MDSRYIAVIYNAMIYTEQQLRRYNFGQTLHSRTTPHPPQPPYTHTRASYGPRYTESALYWCTGSLCHPSDQQISYQPNRINLSSTTKNFYYPCDFTAEKLIWRQRSRVSAKGYNNKRTIQNVTTSFVVVIRLMIWMYVLLIILFIGYTAVHASDFDHWVTLFSHQNRQ